MRKKHKTLHHLPVRQIQASKSGHGPLSPVVQKRPGLQARSTIIAWTHYTWNFIQGCSRVSSGCVHCYAERLSTKYAKEWGVAGLPWTKANAEQNVRLRADKLGFPYELPKEPARVFVNSMSDCFHELVPDDLLHKAFEIMNDPALRHLSFQILTKRPERVAKWAGPWSENIWMGTSVEDHRVVHRIDELRKCGAAVKFLSLEPLLGPLSNLDLTDIDWVIVGGESGPGYRWMDHGWAREIRDQCLEAGVAFFFKQSSAFTTERGTSLIEKDGTRWFWHQYPDDLAAPEQDLSGTTIGAKKPSGVPILLKSQPEDLE